MQSEAADRSLQKVLKQKGEGTVAIFDRGEGCACYGDDARLLAREVFKSDVCMKKITLAGGVPMHYLYLSSNQYKRVVRELIMFLRYRVELYKLQEGQWTLKAKGTVGNAGDFDDLIGDISTSGSTVMAISISGEGTNHISTSFWDMDELRVTTTEFNDTAVLSQTEQCIVGMNPRECLLVDCNEPAKKKVLATLLQKAGILLTPYKPSHNVTDEQLQQVFRTPDIKIAETLKSLVKIQYTFFNMASQPQFAKKFTLTDYKTSGFMHLDGAAVRALELFSTNYFHDMSTSGTLFGVLNKCKTAGGQRLLRDWIARPLCDLRILKERQDAVAALVDSPAERSALRNTFLPRVPDVAQLSRKLLNRKGRLQDCYRIYQLITLLCHFEQALRAVYERYELATAIKELLLEPLVYALNQFERYRELIRSTVDMEHFEKSHSFRIKPSIDPALLEIAGEMEEVQKQIQKTWKKSCARLGVEPGTMKLDSNAQHGYYYRVTLKDEKHIRKSKDLTVISTTKGQGVMFRDDALIRLNDRYVDLNRVYSATQEELEKKVVETCAGYTVSLAQLNSTLSITDVLVSLATLAAESPQGYVRPTLETMGNGVLELRGCRHAVLETSLGGQYIPNDVVLDKDNRLIILTGANMGGKSTYLRSAALCVLLAQIGSFVPCSLARISIVDGIFTRIGASDQQTKGISTFMAEMLDSSSILQTATPNSLVIVDELGRGTSTFDGFGLAWAIASDLLERVRCFCLYATHFHEMADLSENEGAVAMQMTVNAESDKLVMLYEIRPGKATSSFGLAIARMVGFPEHVVTAAAEELKRLEMGTVKHLKSVGNEELRDALLNL